MNSQKFPVVILAGSPPQRDKIMEYANVDYKALIDIHGKPMIDYGLSALRDSGIASYILIVGIPKDLVKLPDGLDESIVEFLEMEGESVDKIYNAGMYVLEKGKTNPEIFSMDKKYILYFSADVPTLTGDMFRYFINECSDFTGDLYYSVVEKQVMDAEFPNNGRSFMKIKDKKFAGGDLVFIDGEVLKERYDAVKLVTENRKSFLRGVFFVSPILFLKLVLGRITINDVERLMSKVFKVNAKLVISKYANIAFDVDKPHQLDMVRDYIAKHPIGS